MDGDGAIRGTVVRERRSRVDVIFGFLAVVFAAALVRGLVAGPTGVATRVVVYGVMPLVLALSIYGWIRARRHPARLEITPDAIQLVHRGRPNTVTLLRSAGDLHVVMSRIGSGRYPVPWLEVPGSKESIPLQTFDLGEIREASRANGWHWADD